MPAVQQVKGLASKRRLLRARSGVAVIETWRQCAEQRGEAFGRAGLPVYRTADDAGNNITTVPMWLWHAAGWCVPPMSQEQLRVVRENQQALEAAWRVGGADAVDALVKQLGVW